MLKKVGFISGGIVLAAAIFFAFAYRPACSCCVADKITISEIKYGRFVESIPLSGTMKDKTVVVDIDELYFRRIKTGLRANIITDTVSLFVARIDSIVDNGRFTADLKFIDPK